jgi:hypothetical protein
VEIPCAYVAAHAGIVLDDSNSFIFRGPFITTQLLDHPPMATVSGTASGDSVVVSIQVDDGAGFFQTLTRGTPPVRDSTAICVL